MLIHLYIVRLYSCKYGSALRLSFPCAMQSLIFCKIHLYGSIQRLMVLWINTFEFMEKSLIVCYALMEK